MKLMKMSYNNEKKKQTALATLSKKERQTMLAMSNMQKNTFVQKLIIKNQTMGTVIFQHSHIQDIHRYKHNQTDQFHTHPSKFCHQQIYSIKSRIRRKQLLLYKC